MSPRLSSASGKRKLNNTTTVPSTAAIVSLKESIESKITAAKQEAQNLIDDTVEGGSDKTWSVDKIKQFVASVDDTVVVGTIDDRNQLAPHDSLVAFVLDTSDDDTLTEEFRGKPYTYIYANGTWNKLTPVGSEIDTELFVKYSDVVDDPSKGGDHAVLSAKAGQTIINQVNTTIENSVVNLITDQVKIKDGKITLSAQPLGTINMNTVEVTTEDGIDVIDAHVSGDKEVTIDVDNVDDYNGKVARVSYIAKIK